MKKVRIFFLPFFISFLVLAYVGLIACNPGSSSEEEEVSFYQNIIYVDIDVDVTADKNGESWATAFYDLQNALAASKSGDQIWVAEGTYGPGPAETDTFELSDDVALYGGFAGDESNLEDRDWETNVTTLDGDASDDGNNSYHVVSSESLDESAILDGFVITDGSASGTNDKDRRGGGMYNYLSSPTVRNCVFSSNEATAYGGGMYNSSSSPTVKNCDFSSNEADAYGGGIHNYSSSPTVIDCEFTGNKANNGSGGGMSNKHSSPMVENCVFFGK